MMVSLITNFHCTRDKQITDRLHIITCVTKISQTPVCSQPTQASGDGVKERGAACIQALEEKQTCGSALVQQRLQKTHGLLHVCNPSTDHLHLIVGECTRAVQAIRNLLHHAGGHALAQSAQLTLKYLICSGR